MSIVPSYVGKLGRAEKHLVELKAAIETYSGTDVSNRPYAVRRSVEGKRKRDVFRLHFTRRVDGTPIPLIAADAIYNMRSSLEHLMAAMAPASKRDSLTFPVFFRGVWNPPVEGENPQRLKDRARWAAIAAVLPNDAVAFLRVLQPPDDAGKNGQEPHHLRLLNQFSNTDRHTKLPLMVAGLQAGVFRNYQRDGSYTDGIARPRDGSFFEDDAEIGVPKGTVKVDVSGIAQIVIRTQLKDADGGAVNIPVLDFIDDGIEFLRDTVIPKLAPFVRTPGRRR